MKPEDLPASRGSLPPDVQDAIATVDAVVSHVSARTAQTAVAGLQAALAEREARIAEATRAWAAASERADDAEARAQRAASTADAATVMVTALANALRFVVSNLREVLSRDPRTGSAWGPAMRAQLLAEAERVADAALSPDVQELLARAAEPIPMVLHCPACGTQHVDAPEPKTGWTNPPHKSHLCARCRVVWRPADVPTTGVAAIATRGARDTWTGSAARPLAEYHEDLGDVLWWAFPVQEAPWIGVPYDDDWPGYHTHWTPLPPVPAEPGSQVPAGED